MMGTKKWAPISLHTFKLNKGLQFSSNINILSIEVEQKRIIKISKQHALNITRSK